VTDKIVADALKKGLPAPEFEKHKAKMLWNIALALERFHENAMAGFTCVLELFHNSFRHSQVPSMFTLCGMHCVCFIDHWK
jgi:hydroxypyruvate isomerase